MYLAWPLLIAVSPSNHGDAKAHSGLWQRGHLAQAWERTRSCNYRLEEKPSRYFRYFIDHPCTHEKTMVSIGRIFGYPDMSHPKPMIPRLFSVRGGSRYRETCPSNLGLSTRYLYFYILSHMYAHPYSILTHKFLWFQRCLLPNSLPQCTSTRFKWFLYLFSLASCAAVINSSQPLSQSQGRAWLRRGTILSLYPLLHHSLHAVRKPAASWTCWFLQHCNCWFCWCFLNEQNPRTVWRAEVRSTTGAYLEPHLKNTLRNNLLFRIQMEKKLHQYQSICTSEN